MFELSMGMASYKSLKLFQAEDGIRDFCLSRGLGDVYKRQVMVVSGCIIGTVIGMLPGLGPMSIIAIMIPIAISIGDPASALILLAGVYYLSLIHI